jgi:hypothetical protein
MKKSSREADSPSASQEIPRLLWHLDLEQNMHDRKYRDISGLIKKGPINKLT